jgi:phosphatidylserine decarboxylase
MLAREGYSTIAVTLLLSLILGGIGYWASMNAVSIPLYMIAVALLGFVLYFFRDPERTPPENADELLISPADGKVILLYENIEHDFFDGPCTQISIFLSPLNVHVNRVPASGRISYAKYHPGEYLVAWHEKASELNERSEFGLEHASGRRVYFRQITGFIARRIVFDIKEGDDVKAGQKFGMMKFGSRMDILVPADTKLRVKKGDVTVAGETIMGHL